MNVNPQKEIIKFLSISDINLKKTMSAALKENSEVPNFKFEISKKIKSWQRTNIGWSFLFYKYPKVALRIQNKKNRQW